MSKSITVRDVPADVAAELAARAARTGRSLQEYLRAQLMELARLPDPEDLMNRVRARKESTESRLERNAILTHRDADRR
jgi:plasmid stability protein